MSFFMSLKELNFLVIFFDSPQDKQMLFQDPATGIMEGIITLHHDIMFFLVMIAIFVFYLLVKIVQFFAVSEDPDAKLTWAPIKVTHDAPLEIIWTLIPVAILVLIGVPSLSLIYHIDNIITPTLTLKAIGHQWYWHYEYRDSVNNDLVRLKNELGVRALTNQLKDFEAARAAMLGSEGFEKLFSFDEAKDIFIVVNKRIAFLEAKVAEGISEANGRLKTHIEVRNALIQAVTKQASHEEAYETFLQLEDAIVSLKEKIQGQKVEVPSSNNVKLVKVESYMTDEDDLRLGTFRLLEVQDRINLPEQLHIRALVSSADVLHSWAIPSFGVKVDACPGRLNEITFYIKRQGTFYGQCSEICGINHAFMPIVINVKSYKEHLKWLYQKLADN